MPKILELSNCRLGEDTGKAGLGSGKAPGREGGKLQERDTGTGTQGKLRDTGKAPGHRENSGTQRKDADTATAPTGEGERLRFPRNSWCQGRSRAIPSGKTRPGHGPGAQRGATAGPGRARARVAPTEPREAPTEPEGPRGSPSGPD